MARLGASFLVRLPEGLLARLRELSSQTGLSRSFLVREALSHYLAYLKVRLEKEQIKLLSPPSERKENSK